MEEGCKNHKETLYSSKGKIVYVVGNPCDIYRLYGNPIVIIGNIDPFLELKSHSCILCGTVVHGF